MKVSPRLSASLAIGNLFATIAVVAIHYCSVSAIDLHGPVRPNDLFQQLVCNGMARVAVPFFALVSGFFMATSLRSGYKDLVRKKARSILVPYLLSLSTIFVLMVVFGLTEFQMGLRPLAFAYLKSIGSPAISAQFWYLRDLLVLTAISPIVLYRHRVLDVVAGCALLVLWTLNVQFLPKFGAFYLIDIDTLFFFWLGGALSGERHRWLESLVRTGSGLVWLLVPSWILLLSLRILAEPNINIWYTTDFTLPGILLYKASILVGVPALLALGARFSDNAWLRSLSVFTFFVYLFHLKPLYSILKHWNHGPYSFYSNFPLVTALVFGMAYAASIWMRPAYALVTGGRIPRNR